MSEQIGAGVTPIAIDRTADDAEDLRHERERQSGEEMQFDDLGGPTVLALRPSDPGIGGGCCIMC